jgi:ferrochelatase
VDAVGQWAMAVRNQPELRFVQRYHDDAGYIDALAAGVRAQWEAQGRSNHLVMSFHGVPERTLHLGDPYHCECRKTGRLLAGRLGLQPTEWTLTFQSRFGRAKWLEPYTEPTLRALAQRGVHEVDVVCPGFTGDCLETLEEIAQEGRDAFLAAGGTRFRYLPCLNADAAWIAALGALAQRHLAGWPLERPSQQAGEASRAAALALGAAD